MSSAEIHDIFSSIGMQVLLTVVVAIVTQLIIRSILEQVVRGMIKHHKYSSAKEEQKREDTLIRVFKTLSGVLVWVIAIIVILSELKINIAALLTGAGLIGVVVGMGAQNVIKDYLAGILIIMENQFRVGDIVTLATSAAGPVSGVVEDISIRVTRLRDLDGNLHIVPNGGAAVITNLSFEFAQVNVDVGVGYHSDIDAVEKIINRVGKEMANDAPWSDNIIEPIQFMRVDNFSESSVTVKSVGKVKPGTQWDTAGEFRRRLMRAFEKHAIEIPLPQLVVHKSK